MKKKQEEKSKQVVILTTWDTRLEAVNKKLVTLQATVTTTYETYSKAATAAEALVAALEVKSQQFQFAWVSLMDYCNWLNREEDPTNIQSALDSVLTQRDDMITVAGEILTDSNNVRKAVKKAEVAATTWRTAERKHDAARAAYMAARCLADNAARDTRIKAKTPAAVTKAEKAVA